MKCLECDAPVRCKGLCERHYKRQLAAAKAHPCACGCGGLTSYTYVWGHHTRLFTREEQSRRARHNNGDKQRDRGTGRSYRKVAGRHEHRIVAEAMLGRPLQPGEIVHHEDGNKRNNDPANLEVMTQSEHARIHMLERWARRG